MRSCIALAQNGNILTGAAGTADQPGPQFHGSGHRIKRDCWPSVWQAPFECRKENDRTIKILYIFGASLVFPYHQKTGNNNHHQPLNATLQSTYPQFRLASVLGVHGRAVGRSVSQDGTDPSWMRTLSSAQSHAFHSKCLLWYLSQRHRSIGLLNFIDAVN